jgi:tRNA(Ile)-lysidine synthase
MKKPGALECPRLHSEFAQTLLGAVRSKGLLRPGDRLGVAVSGGADSVALLYAMHELQPELGLVLKVVHFNHNIRGAEADDDERFVQTLAQQLGLEFLNSSANTQQHAREHKHSLETAARTLRYNFFRELIHAGTVNKIATAHTMDDQAETLLLRLIRGTGLKGLRGVHDQTAEGIIRPMLSVRRADVERYLRSLDQPWREDATNKDLHHTRNRIRHELLPLLARDYNPNISETLARTAEVAAADEEFLSAETAKLIPLVLLPGKPTRGGGRAATNESIALDAPKLLLQPLAIRRRLVRAAAERLGLSLELHQVESALGLRPGGKVAISSEWQICRSARELRFEPPARERGSYEYALSVDGEAVVPEMNIVVRTRLIPLDSDNTRGTLDGQNLHPSAVLVVRNWRAGDHFQQAYASRPRKIKELLDEIKPPAELRSMWPVVEANGAIIWVLGARNPRLLLGSEELRIETHEQE